MKKDGILGIGVATMDIYVNHNRMYPGGNEYNAACNAKFFGKRSGFLGVFGDDENGKILEYTLKKCGVDVSMCHHEEGLSGYSLVELKDDGDRVFLDWNKEGVTDVHPITFTDEELAYVKEFEVACAGRCSTVTLERLKLLYDNGVDLCYDFHAIYSEKEIKSISPYIKYAFFSCSHLQLPQMKEYLKMAVDAGAKIAIGTRGIDSIIAYDGENWYEQPTFPVLHVYDALGAGDSFIGAFLASYLLHCEEAEMQRIQRALKEAARHSAGVVLIEGSIGIGFDIDDDRIKAFMDLIGTKG